MILADTDVVSEFMRAEPDPRVLAWASTVPPRDLAICAVTVQEIEHGVLRLPTGTRRDRLREAWASVLGSFRDRVLPYDAEAARATGRLLADAEADGRPMPLADAQIAGTCLAHGLDLATRNVRDFTRVTGLLVVDPFSPIA